LTGRLQGQGKDGSRKREGRDPATDRGPGKSSSKEKRDMKT